VRVSGNAPVEAFGGGAAVPTNAAAPLSEMARIAQEATDHANQVAFTGAAAALTDAKTALLYNPESGILNQKGEVALSAPEQAQAGWQAAVEQIQSGLTSPLQKAQFAKFATQDWSQVNLDVQRHVASQRAVVDTEKTNGLTFALTQEAVKTAELGTASPDPAVRLSAIGKVMSNASLVAENIRAKGKREGMPQEMIDEQVAKSSGALISSVIVSQLTLGNPESARLFLEQGKDYLTVDARIALQSKVETGLTESTAIRAVDRLTAKYGLDKTSDIDAALREQYIDRPEVLRAARQEMTVRAGEFERDRSSAIRTNTSTVLDEWRKTPNFSVSMLTNSAAYLALPAEEAIKTKDYIVRSMASNRERYEKDLEERGFSSYIDFLSSPSEMAKIKNVGELRAFEPKWGRANTNDAIQRWQKWRDGIENPSIDTTLLRETVTSFGIDKKNEGMLWTRFTDVVRNQQRTNKQPMSAEDKVALMRNLGQQSIVEDNPFWFNNTTTALQEMASPKDNLSLVIPYATLEKQPKSILADYRMRLVNGGAIDGTIPANIVDESPLVKRLLSMYAAQVAAGNYELANRIARGEFGRMQNPTTKPTPK